MKFGVTMFPTDYSIDPITLGKEAEARGFESLFFPEHTHIPTSRQTPWPGGAPLPQEYWHTHDPFVALGAVAAVTTNLKLGTGICLVIERDPIVLAKEIASLDMISNGRFLFGIGAGWNREEMENHGTDPKKRFPILRERVLAMKEIWTKDEAEYHGKYVNFDPVWSWPKPVQKPHPPVMMGGYGPKTLERIVDYADEWMPIHGRAAGGSITEGAAKLQAMAKEAGRDRIPVSVFGCPPNPEVIQHYVEGGIDRLVFWVPPAPAETVIPHLDRLAGVKEQFGG